MWVNILVISLMKVAPSNQQEVYRTRGGFEDVYGRPLCRGCHVLPVDSQNLCAGAWCGVRSHVTRDTKGCTCAGRNSDTKRAHTHPVTLDHASLAGNGSAIGNLGHPDPGIFAAGAQKKGEGERQSLLLDAFVATHVQSGTMWWEWEWRANLVLGRPVTDMPSDSDGPLSIRTVRYCAVGFVFWCSR